MGYTKTTWVNDTTALNATNMNNIENWNELVAKGTHAYATSATGNDTYVVAFTNPYLAYNAGMIINIKPDAGNTGAATIDVDTIGVQDIKKFDATGKVALATGDIIAAGIYTLIHDGTDFILLNPTSINASLFTAAGDIAYASAANTPAKLVKGTDGYVLKMVSGLPAWVAKTGAVGTATRSTSITTTDVWTIGLGYAPEIVFVSIYSTDSNADPRGLARYVVTAAGEQAMDCIPSTGGFGAAADCANLSYSDAGGEDVKITDMAISGTNLVITFSYAGTSEVRAALSYSAI
jgi:hypothetical protein